MARPLYRVRQFLQALTARVRPEEWEEVENLLPPQAVALFRQMPRSDQRHSLDVMHTLRARGHEARPLLTAALLHDVAKADGVRLWHRVPLVLIKAVRPAWLGRLASPRRESWRYGFYLLLTHPQRGAEWALRAGCDPQAAELICRHQDAPAKDAMSQMDIWLRALQAADEAN